MSEFAVIQHLRTARYLRGSQVAGRLRRIGGRLWERPVRFSRRGVPPPPGCRWSPRRPFLPQRMDNTADEISQGVLTFLNRRECLGWPLTWNVDDLPLLWRFHLHYFDFVWSLPYAGARDVVRSWIADHPLQHHRVGWHPYPISVRVVNWCCYFFGNRRRDVDADSGFTSELWHSIFLQAEWLRRHLESDLRANHLLENAAALALAGACFSGEEARVWGRIGRSLLRQQLDEQVLEDGGHVERSPMYQLRLVYVLASLMNSGDARLADIVVEPLRRLSAALVLLCHPDGGIALLNDSALAVGQEVETVVSYVRKLDASFAETVVKENGAFALDATGYYGWRSADGTYLVCDAGELGPDYNPGHAHGDLLSFELSVRGHRIVVDAGVHDYGAGYLRQYCRSTQAHNTVEVDGCDQAEFWGRFRVARRAHPHDVIWKPWDGGFRLAGWHDGYARLPGAPQHRRRFVWHNPEVLMVGDRITANAQKRLRSRIHFHPTCRFESITAHGAIIESPAGRLHIACAGAQRLGAEFTHYCPEFGRCLESPTLVLTASGDDVHLGFALLLDDRRATLDLAEGLRTADSRFPW